MKNALKSLSFLMVLGGLIFVSSCSDDDGGIDIGGGDGGSFTVADGLYIAGVAGSDTTITTAAQLTSAVVEASGFGTQERTGFQRAWIYLNAGSYFFAEVDEQKIETVYGGSVTTVTVDPSNAEEGPDEYFAIDVEENGAAFSIASSGVHYISFDNLTGEALVAAVGDWGIIGGSVYESACTGVGFSSDVDLTKGESTSDGTVWSATGVRLKNGALKFRMDDVWKIDRRTDKSNHDESSGYVALVNVGGSLDFLEEGGADIAFTDPNTDASAGGLYDVTLTLTSNGTFEAELTRSGDGDACAFNANDYKWGIIGNAVDQDDLNMDENSTPDGWESDQDLFYKGNIDGVETWIGVVTFEGDETNEFKFRANDEWARQLGGTLTADGVENTLTFDGNAPNISSPGAGDYYIIITTADQGVTWKGTMKNIGWGIVGNATNPEDADDDGTPDGWQVDTDLVGQGTVSTIATHTLTLELFEGEYKFRAGDDWAFNLGSDLTDLQPDGDNFQITDPGMYDVVLTFDGSSYSATVTKQ